MRSQKERIFVLYTIACMNNMLLFYVIIVEIHYPKLLNFAIIHHIMKKTISLLTLFAAGAMHSQTVQVNPDGTHTVIHQTESSTSVQVNPDGTHTVRTGNAQVNPNGTHTVIQASETTSVQVNTDGTHTTIQHSETNSVQVNPDGTHTLLAKRTRQEGRWEREVGRQKKKEERNKKKEEREKLKKAKK